MFGLVSCVGRGSGGGFGVVGKLMDLDRWISVSWIRWGRGFGLVGLDRWRLVRFSVEIGEFLGGMGSFGFGCWVWVLLGLN